MNRHVLALMSTLMPTLTLALGCISGAHAQQHYWYDADARRPLWAQAGLAADFSVGAPAQVLKPAGLIRQPGASSPVFSDQPDGARVRALPGGVVLQFRAQTDAPARQVLLARHGLTLVREIGDDGRRCLIASPAGEATLTLANRLHESGDFAAASPNWWQPRQRK